MTSSEARHPKGSRKFLWLTVFIVLLFGGYSAGWFYVADRVKAEVVSAVARMNRGDVRVECDNPQVGGFPFRIGVSCDHLGYEDGSRQLQASASGFRSLAQVYQPTRALAELDGPLHLSAPGLGSIRLDWDRLRASVRIATPLPERVSVEAEGLKGTSEASGSAGSPLFAAARTDGHLRPNGADIDWAGSFVGLTVDPGVVDGRILPTMDGSGEATVKDGVALLRSRPKSLRGQAVDIAALNLASGEAAVSIRGPVSVAEDGLIDADLVVTVSNPMAVADVLATAFPERQGPIRQGFMGLSLLGNEPSMPLKIVRGKATLGFIPLGDIRPVK
ncbi:MAG: DUF2125 domain-containing protein [Rhizobiaceae bacterium]|nr:MAG: DUF2125 domain-containing protein [Rhizobiaceae bacterium]CAG0958754.1 hypothetical protein RHIZO_00589 [Rhizobiaceae bacterium]